MKKPVFAMLLGGVLGVFDGLSALISAPQEAPNIVGIVIGSTVKGVVVGLIIGLVAQRTRSMAVGALTGGRSARCSPTSSRSAARIFGKSCSPVRPSG